MVAQRHFPIAGLVLGSLTLLLLLPTGGRAQYQGPSNFGFTEGQYPYYHSPYFYRAYRNGIWGYYPRTLADPGPAAQDQLVLVTPHELSAVLNVYVPEPDATVWIEGKRTVQKGTVRKFVSPPLQRGASYWYDVRVEWLQDGRKNVRTDVAAVQAGQESSLRFFPAPAAAAPSAAK
jgi:uncharacterized protein (TIGR03000 family)